MDLKDFEKHIIPKIESGKSIEAVRNIIKTDVMKDLRG